MVNVRENENKYNALLNKLIIEQKQTDRSIKQALNS